MLVERHFDGLLGRVAVSSEAGLLVGTVSRHDAARRRLSSSHAIALSAVAAHVATARLSVPLCAHHKRLMWARTRARLCIVRASYRSTPVRRRCCAPRRTLRPAQQCAVCSRSHPVRGVLLVHGSPLTRTSTHEPAPRGCWAAPSRAAPSLARGAQSDLVYDGRATTDAPWPADWQQRVAGINQRCAGGVAVVGVYSFYRDAAAASQQFAAALPSLASQLHRDSARATRLDATLSCTVALAVSVKTPR